MDRIATEREELYRCRPPEGIQVTILVTPAVVDNGFPEETETEQAVIGLKGGRAGGLSIMRAEDLKVWLWEASWGNNPVRRQWQLLVRIIQMKLEYGVVL